MRLKHVLAVIIATFLTISISTTCVAPAESGKVLVETQRSDLHWYVFLNLTRSGFQFFNRSQISDEITLELLLQYCVYVTNAYEFNNDGSLAGGYSDSEVKAILQYVAMGGGLFVIGDDPDDPNWGLYPITEPYGIFFTGNWGEDIDTWAEHPITEGYYPDTYLSGASGTTFEVKVGVVTLAWAQNSGGGSPSGAGEPHLVIAEEGLGRVVVIGDEDLLDEKGNPLALNILNWLCPEPVGGEIQPAVSLTAALPLAVVFIVAIAVNAGIIYRRKLN